MGFGFDKFTDKLHAVADADDLQRLLCAVRADVDRHLAVFGNRLVLLTLAKMDRLDADHARDVVFADRDLLADKHTAVNAAHLVKFEEAAGGNIRHHHANLVHMRGEHEAVLGRLFALFVYQQIAEGVNFVIGVALYFFDDQLSDGAFVPRNAVCHAEPFEQRNINHGTHLRS